MTYDNFTTKAQESILKAQQMAGANDQQMVDTAHLLRGILQEDENVAGFLLKKAGVNLPTLEAELETLIQSFPKIQGGVEKQYLSGDANKVLSKAKTLAKEMGDEFIPVELVLLAIIQGNDRTAKLLREQGASDENIRKALAELRKGRKVTDQGSENNYNALAKYAVNLNERA